jgi:hypothetical protein
MTVADRHHHDEGKVECLPGCFDSATKAAFEDHHLRIGRVVDDHVMSFLEPTRAGRRKAGGELLTRGLVASWDPGRRERHLHHHRRPIEIPKLRAGRVDSGGNETFGHLAGAGNGHG